MTADALTKIVFAWREKAAPMLARHRADAVLLERDGAPSCMFHHHATPATRLNSIEALQRYFLYTVLTLLFSSGAAWAYWNDLVSSPGDLEMSAKAWAMEIHGAASMASPVLVGTLLSASCEIRVARASES